LRGHEKEIVMYQRILIPVDGSTTSERALQEALSLVAGSKALLRLVYVLEEVYMLDAEGLNYIDYSALQEAVRHTGERALAQAAKTARGAGVSVETALIEAGGRQVANVIDDDARHWPADLIVIGTHGRSGLSRFLMGSVADGVVRGAPAQVLLVRAE
jgi:nucleotide-binding universal stress UspA family protein